MVDVKKVNRLADDINKLKDLACKVYAEADELFGNGDPITMGIGSANCDLDEAIGAFNKYIEKHQE